MFCEKIDNVFYDFEISGKYACIKKIRLNNNDGQLKTIVIPSKVHYRNYTYIVNAISGYTSQESQYKTVVTDRRRKDYGKQEYVGEYTRIHDVIDLREDDRAEIILQNPLFYYIESYFLHYPYGRINIRLNDGLKIINRDAFTRYEWKRIDIPNSVKTIEDGAFIYCDRLTLIIDNEPGSIKIGKNAIAVRRGEELEPSSDFEIVYLRPKTSWISKLINKLKNILYY